VNVPTGSVPSAPKSSSAACVVVAVVPDCGLELCPLFELVWSSVPIRVRPENSAAFIARRVTLGCVIVIVSPLASARTLWAARVTVRTSAGFVLSTACAYVLPAVSVAVTVPATASIASERMMLFPAATPAAGTVTTMVVPAVVDAAVPMSLTNAIAPRASRGPAPSASTLRSIAATARVAVPRKYGRRSPPRVCMEG
jgi:hypothetical protein